MCVCMCVSVCVCVCVCVYYEGKNIHEEAARVLQEGLHECAQRGELDFEALLMVEVAEIEAQRGKTDDSLAMLQVLTQTQTFLVLYVKHNVGGSILTLGFPD